MKLNSLALANALATVSLAAYIVCRVASLVAPDFLFVVGQSWFHTINLSATKGGDLLSLNSFLVGAISISVLAWITVYATAELYNRLTK